MEFTQSCTDGCPLQNQSQDGWQQRFVGDQRMVEESAKVYESLGLEVQIRPLEITNIPKACQSCSITQGKCFILYTRPKKKI